MRLAWQMRELDWREMLHKLTPRQFDEWYLASSLGLDGEGWWQTGELVSAIHAIVRASLYSHHGKKMPSSEFIEPRSYMPETAFADKKADVENKLDALQARLERG